MELNEFLRGEKLYGDDFSAAELAMWYEDERQGYFNLSGAGRDSYEYSYHALNTYYGFKRLPKDIRFSNVLGFGSAFGEELSPIVKRIERLTIIEPADGFRRDKLENVPIHYVSPNVDGTLPFPDGSFDLITCLGVLHHIPNVSYVARELGRVVRKGGYALIREPIISMGDWNNPRKGLTKRERGIPERIFLDIIEKSGFSILSQKKCVFSLTSRLKHVMKKQVYNSWVVVAMDAVLSSLFSWNVKYHPQSFFQKIRPTALYLVCIRT